MIVLAVVLLVVVAVVVAGVLLSSQTVHDLSVLRVIIPVTDAGMFLAGGVAALLVVIAAILMRSAISRSRARRRTLGSGRSTNLSRPGTTSPDRADEPPTYSRERARLPREADTLTREDPRR